MRGTPAHDGHSLAQPGKKLSDTSQHNRACWPSPLPHQPPPPPAAAQCWRKMQPAIIPGQELLLCRTPAPWTSGYSGGPGQTTFPSSQEMEKGAPRAPPPCLGSLSWLVPQD